MSAADIHLVQVSLIVIGVISGLLYLICAPK